MTSFIPLLSVQRRDHRIGYDMPVPQHASSLDATAASAAARGRLRRPLLIAAPKPLAKSQALVVSEPLPDVVGSLKAPLNMLAPPCGQFLITLAALRHGVTRAMILSHSRKRNIVAARHDAAALIYQHTQHSLPATGRLMGRDHTSVLSGLRKLGRTVKLVEPQDWSDHPAAVDPIAPKPARTEHDPKTGRFARGTALQRAVQRAYQNEVMPSVLADEYGCSAASVKVIAHRLGIKRSDYRQKVKLGAAGL